MLKLQQHDTTADHLGRLRQRLAQFDLRLLDRKWAGWKTHYRFRCPRGHVTARGAIQIVHYTPSCPTCRQDEQLAKLAGIAEAAGGRLLSKVYAGRTAAYHLVCGAGHTFTKSADKLHEGSWCRQCAHRQHSERMRDPDGMARMREAAAARGGECLTSVYTKLVDRYRFRCAASHEWETVGHEVVRGAWCRLCANSDKSEAYLRKDGLARLRRLAKEKRGVCLSTEYTGSKALYRFRCSEGHEWETLGARIVRGGWCLACRHESMRFGLDRMHEIAAGHGGRCLSTEYRNTTTRVEWECAQGHRWLALPSSAVLGHWCAICSRERVKLGIDRMREVAVERGGRCISKVYVNSSTRLEWECGHGHRWLATPNTITQGHWCARCYFISITTTEKTRRKRRHEAVPV